MINVSGMNARSTGYLAGSVRDIGVVALGKSLADELGADGVSVVCVHPGLTLTERNDGDQAHLEKASANAPGRAIAADEVAAAITLLASPRGPHGSADPGTGRPSRVS